MKHRTQDMLMDPTSTLSQWLLNMRATRLGFGRDLVERNENPLYAKEDFDDALCGLVAAGWIERGVNPEPSRSQVAFASLTCGASAAGAYPTHYGYSPTRSPAFAEWARG